MTKCVDPNQPASLLNMGSERKPELFFKISLCNIGIFYLNRLFQSIKELSYNLRYYQQKSAQKSSGNFDPFSLWFKH